ncbi:hypothetical protein BSL78_27098 [Apostichopus japonicus]|uniref:Uncharacterized protein n=1 Tax=Stichopus japonicus TaxID=307972 RepID=A0A2G8JK21_STIJA|nr:hypothetical protein BSL78_27098 [Apostichopus japonicus]
MREIWDWEGTRGASEVEKNEAIDEMFSQDERRQYDHHSEKLTLASSQNAPKVSQQKEHAHVLNRVNVRGNDYSQDPARVGHTNHDYGQPANYGYYPELPAKQSTESYNDTPQHSSSSHMYRTQNLRNLPMNNHPETKPPNSSFGPTESGLYETIPPITGGASYEPDVRERGTSAHSSGEVILSRLKNFKKDINYSQRE